MKAYCNFFLQASYNYNRHAYIIAAHFAKRWQSTVSYCKQGRMKSYPYEWLLKDADTCVASFAYQEEEWNQCWAGEMYTTRWCQCCILPTKLTEMATMTAAKQAWSQISFTMYGLYVVLHKSFTQLFINHVLQRPWKHPQHLLYSCFKMIRCRFSPLWIDLIIRFHKEVETLHIQYMLIVHTGCSF